MQPKTKLQRQVLELSHKLKSITSAQMKWGESRYTPESFFCKAGNICAWCGEVMGDTLICPHCGKSHSKRACNNQWRSVYYNFNILQVVGEFQVVRTYEVQLNFRRKEKCKVFTNEVCQSWINAKGTETRVARGKKGGLFQNPYFDVFSEMEIRSKNKYNYNYYSDLQEWAQRDNLYPKTRTFSPILKRNGLKDIEDIKKSGCLLVDFMCKLIKVPFVETLLKTGNAHLIGYNGLEDVWKELRITLRHNYNIKDWHIWKDTILLMRRFNMDTLNPYYICADNIKELHDKLVERKRKQEEQERLQRDLEKALADVKAKEEYIKNKSKYFGLLITDNDLTIEPLKSVEEFVAEGAEMHHCVYSCGYYKQADKLILSAKINGKRIETIEVSLKSFKILQCRGKYNQDTPYHKRIVDLMESNMSKVRAIRRKRVAVAVA